MAWRARLRISRKAGSPSKSSRNATVLMIMPRSFWDSREAIQGFAGQDIEKAVFYPEDDRFLVDRDLTVHHYEVAGTE